MSSWFGLADSASCVTKNVCSHRFWFWSKWKFDNRLCILLFLNIIIHEKPTPSASVVTGDEGRWYILSFKLYYFTLCCIADLEAPINNVLPMNVSQDLLMSLLLNQRIAVTHLYFQWVSEWSRSVMSDSLWPHGL